MDSATVALIIYIMVALGFSFLCSIWEAVFLSTSASHVEVLVKRNKRSGFLMRELKQKVDESISAILTLNTIAHTVGAAGAGAQAAVIFGSNWIGLISAVLTLLILVFSEIIPKTVGAIYWQQLVPFTAYGIRILTSLLYPIVWSMGKLTRFLTGQRKEPTISRSELEVLARIGVGEGVLKDKEHTIFRNLLRLEGAKVADIMTPRTVVFTLPEDLTVGEVLSKHSIIPYTRIPLHLDTVDQVTGFALRYQILSAASEGKTEVQLKQLARPIHSVPEMISVAWVLEEFTKRQEHIFLVIDEYGGFEGIVTLEDALESLLGTEITDETDIVTDLRELAKKRRSRRLPR